MPVDIAELVEDSYSLILRRDVVHLVLGQGETKQVQVLGLVIWVRCFRYNRTSPLNIPLQKNLGLSFVMSLSDLLYSSILSQVWNCRVVKAWLVYSAWSA